MNKMKPRHLPTKNTRTRELRDNIKVQRDFDKMFGEDWWKIRETQRFMRETFETQWD